MRLRCTSIRVRAFLLVLIPLLASRGLQFHGREGAGPAGDLAVAGFDDFELADMITPPITVVAQDPGEMGRLAAELLFRRLSGERGPAQRITLSTNLIARGSGEVPPPAANSKS